MVGSIGVIGRRGISEIPTERNTILSSIGELNSMGQAATNGLEGRKIGLRSSLQHFSKRFSYQRFFSKNVVD